jgi:hypothetical protein
MFMERRFKLGSEIVNSQQTPTLVFSEDNQNLILTFPIISEITPSPSEEQQEQYNPQRHSHRDIFELSTGDAFGTDLTASLVSIGENETVLNLSMKVNSKIPGTGAAFAALARKRSENGNHVRENGNYQSVKK